MFIELLFTNAGGALKMGELCPFKNCSVHFVYIHSEILGMCLISNSLPAQYSQLMNSTSFAEQILLFSIVCKAFALIFII